MNIPKLRNSDAAAAGGKMLINTEWGGFDNSVGLLNPLADTSFRLTNFVFSFRDPSCQQLHSITS